MAATEDLVKLPAWAGGGTREARCGLRPDPGGARGDPGLRLARMVLGEALACLLRLLRAARLLDSSLDGAGARHTTRANAPLRRGYNARGSYSRPTSGLLGGAGCLPALRAGQRSCRSHRHAP